MSKKSDTPKRLTYTQLQTIARLDESVRVWIMVRPHGEMIDKKFYVHRDLTRLQFFHALRRVTGLDTVDGSRVRFSTMRSKVVGDTPAQKFLQYYYFQKGTASRREVSGRVYSTIDNHAVWHDAPEVLV